MNFMDAVKICLRKYFTFRGRAQRSEYWWFYLFTIIVALFAAIIDGSIYGWDDTDAAPVGVTTSLALFIPSLSAAWRRLHDTGRSGWWIGGGILAFVVFGFAIVLARVSFIGSGTESLLIGVFGIVFFIAIIVYLITLLIFLCQDSDPGDNVYGLSTKYDSGSSVFD